MTTLQDFIVLMWLVPVAGLIFIPLLWSLFRLFYTRVEQSRLADIRGYVTADAPGPEKRRLGRIRLEGGRAYVDEVNGCYEAAVEDISKDGICLKDINGKVNPESDHLRVLFRTRRRDYILLARPTWKKLTDKGYAVGAAIQEAPSEWNTLVEGTIRRVNTAPA